ncbi:DinB family protein [Mucilaginibacter calamicampi]|uniref:DinB family protein n=1 Tax=Mucilaginibacter calamicampi TaxID=1302352 RepID=A0ABW2YTT9_9SPHI
MFKEYFAGLFKYDAYCNKKFASLINSANNNYRSTELMSHLLNAQQIWLSRCLGTAFTTNQLWPKWEPDTFDGIIDKNYTEWMNFLNNDPDVHQTIVYKNTKGEQFSSKLIDILAHVINHGTHHRAQIGILLKQNDGVELPSTDYVHYVRGLQ